MSKSNSNSMLKLLLCLSLPLFVLDFVTKEWTVRTFPAPEEFAPYDERSITVIEGFFWLHRVHNRGIAFGGFGGVEHANLIFTFIALAALAAILWFWRRGAFPTRAMSLAAALLVAGILGNLTDRLLRGYVVDFLSFNLGFMMWPSFNVADACICVAAGLLFISAFQAEPEPRPESS